jgi:hypothetical protein
MSYSHRHRDRYRLAVTAVTGVSTVGALTATGWLASVAAQDYTDQQKAKAAEEAQAAKAWAKKYARQQAKYAKAQAAAAEPIVKQRPYVTRTTTQYVQAAGTSAAPGSGGEVAPVSSGSAAAPAAAPAASAPAPAPAPAAPAPAPSGGGGGGSAPAPPPPPPPPPPAPSSGS